MIDDSDDKITGQILHDRMKSVGRNSDSPDIGDIWRKQSEIDEEDQELQKQYADAKSNARKLKKKIIINQFGGSKKQISSNGREIFTKIRTFFNKKSLKQINLANVAAHRKLLAVFVALLVVAVVLIFNRGGSPEKQTLGDSTNGATPMIIQEGELPRERPQNFTLLYPAGQVANEFDVVRISPDSSGASYAYLDRIGTNGTIIRVTQQQVSDSFDVSKTATDFQATSVIQVDDTIVYHGFSEKNSTQSLIFVKNDILVLIRSPQKFGDDIWAGYVASLM